ncbi:hypothetical protein GPECTOR_3g78 [Gonium pectorale]|uniref:Uncharacterized protein n=1 Tax=Gonium pectorale TaxID=33097 RepID=A0A150GZT2_GONPE|nr:hypothetical protein GPECTOR_3g78 [Gonium pectorale]|eukprot:KXZ55427.1 hypothetical protein GPECTOR_3g78 [Gonium pectorale]
MPCCGHGGSAKTLVSQPAPFLGDYSDSTDALLNLSVLKTLSEHVDAATAVACYSVCKAWREAFGFSCQNSTLCTTESINSTRARFTANLHGSVTLEVTQAPAKSQRGFDRHVVALSRNRHVQQLKVHLPAREASEAQLGLSSLSSLAPLTQLSSLIITRNPIFTSAPHALKEDDVAAMAHLRGLTFLELCAAVPPPLGLSRLAPTVVSSLTQLRTLAFGHTSELWHMPQISELCTLLDVCPFLVDLRLRCCAPPRNAEQLPALMGLPLPQRLTNFALTFVRRLSPDELEAAQAAEAAAAPAAAGGQDGEGEYGEYEDPEERWDARSGSDFSEDSEGEGGSETERDRERPGRKASGRRSVSASVATGAADSKSPRDPIGAGGASGDDDEEEDVPPFDVTPMVLSEYQRLLNNELGLTGTLAEPEDLHLGVRVNIMENEDENAMAAVAAALGQGPNNAGAAGGPGGGAAGGILQVAQQLQFALMQMQLQEQNNAAAAAAANVPAGAAGGFQAALVGMLNQIANLQAGAGGAGAGAAAGGGVGGAAAVAAAAAVRRRVGPLPARALQLQLGPLSPHMCYLNVALVPMVTHLAVVGAGMGPNGEDLVQQPTPTRVAPVVLDVRGGGYTQLKSLAITGYIDQDCSPATWMSRGWLSRLPAGMPSLEFLALYDSLPARATDGLRHLSRLEHLELRPLYLRFTGEVRNPLSLPPTALPSRLQQLTLKKISIPAVLPSAGAGAAGADHSCSSAALSVFSSEALANLPDLSSLTNLWLFDCDAPDLTVFRSATRLEDLRLGGTTTTTRLPDLLACFPCLRGAILDVGRAVAPGWWSASQLDAAALDPPPPPSAAKAKAAKAAAAKAGAVRSAAAGAGGSAATAAPDSDDDSDVYHSTEEDPEAASGGGASAAAAADGYGKDGELSTVLGTLVGLTQLTDLVLSFDSPTLFYNPEDEEEDDEEEEDADFHGGHEQGAQGANAAVDEDGASSDGGSSVSSLGSAGRGATVRCKRCGKGAPAANGPTGHTGGGGGGDDDGDDDDEESDEARDHMTRVYDALLAGQSLAALAALQGLWRLRVGLPHGSVWEDVMERMLPALRLAMPRTAVEMDVL